MRTYIFDAFGTLLDIASASRAVFGDRAELAARHADIWRGRQLEFAWVDTMLGRPPDFWDVTCRALDAAAEATGTAEDLDLRDALLAQYAATKPYDDARGLLARLRGDGLKALIYSNGTPEMLRTINREAGLGFSDRELVSVVSAGAFKPDPRAYTYIADHLGVGPDMAYFISSNSWDAAGAANAGFRAIWVNRTGQSFPFQGIALEREVNALADIADATS